MARILNKAKMNDSTQVNFNQSQEISYWAKKYNLTPEAFQQIFHSNNYSITKTLAACTHKAYNACYA